jgi:hypothetical protein
LAENPFNMQIVVLAMTGIGGTLLAGNLGGAPVGYGSFVRCSWHDAGTQIVLLLTKRGGADRN